MRQQDVAEWRAIPLTSKKEKIANNSVKPPNFKPVSDEPFR